MCHTTRSPELTDLILSLLRHGPCEVSRFQFNVEAKLNCYVKFAPFSKDSRQNPIEVRFTSKVCTVIFLFNIDGINKYTLQSFVAHFVQQFSLDV